MEIQITLPKQDQTQPRTSHPPQTTARPVVSQQGSAATGSLIRQECLALLNHIDVLEARLARLERKCKGSSQAEQPKARKHRRKKNQLERSLRCIVPGCNKLYGSITSLKLHLRAKHDLRVKKKRLREELVAINC